MGQRISWLSVFSSSILRSTALFKTRWTSHILLNCVNTFINISPCVDHLFVFGRSFLQSVLELSLECFPVLWRYAHPSLCFRLHTVNGIDRMFMFVRYYSASYSEVWTPTFMVHRRVNVGCMCQHMK